MTCVPAKSLLESYLDDELDAAQRAHVGEHLASCSSCAEVHAQLVELRAGIRPCIAAGMKLLRATAVGSLDLGGACERLNAECGVISLWVP